jgi:hypothetical protein
VRLVEPRENQADELRRKSLEGDSSSDEYDINQMVIYTCDDVPGMSLVGAVTYVVEYDGYEDEYVGVHRYGYVSQNKPAWSLDYTKSFQPAYLDPKDNKYAFTFKPKKGLCEQKVEDEVAPSKIKAKFELTSKHKVPGNALSAKSAPAITKPVKPSEYECRRLKNIEGNKQVMAAFGIPELTNELYREPVKRIKPTEKTTKTTKKVQPAQKGPRRTSARLSGQAGEVAIYRDTRAENYGSNEDEDDEIAKLLKMN